MAESEVGADVKAAFGVTFLVMLAASIIDSGPLGYMVAPIGLLGLGYCAARAPLRYSLMALTFSALAFDYPTEAFAGGVKTPVFNIGAVLFEHLNIVTGIKPLFFSGQDILLMIFGIVAVTREKSGSRVDRAGRMATPRPLVRLAGVSLLGALYVWFSGLVRGGDFGMSLWQVQKVVYLPILFLLYHLGLRGPKDLPALAKVLLIAGTWRALAAVYIKHTVVATWDASTGTAELPTATSHADSMLFASAFVLMLLLAVERVTPRARLLALGVIPILAWGMAANHRRLVWVHVALILVTLYIAMPNNPFKRRFQRAVYYSLPVVAVYAMAGWNSGYGSFFKPVRIARSIVQPQSDGSSLWRELENFNLITTFKTSPIMGFGYGHKYIEAIPLPAVDYSLEYFCPHNSLLGLWAFAGFIGYTAITLMWGAGVYFAMRGYHAAKTPTDRVGAIMCVGAVIVYMVQAFGDIGLGSLTGIHILAPALAMAGKIAVATGGWGGEPAAVARQKKKAAAPARAPGFARATFMRARVG
jgi:hypothetical protein